MGILDFIRRSKKKAEVMTTTTGTEPDGWCLKDKDGKLDPTSFSPSYHSTVTKLYYRYPRTISKEDAEQESITSLIMGDWIYRVEQAVNDGWDIVPVYISESGFVAMSAKVEVVDYAGR